MEPGVVTPTHLLVIHFGQLGDVVLGIPALDALRSSFPQARITSLVGTPADQLVRLAGLSDDVIGVDRHGLRRMATHRAVAEILRLVRRVRALGVDTVVDIHAFYETGLLAWLSGARSRVGPLRENRTLRRAYTSLAPYDLEKHAIDRYMAVAVAAGATPRVSAPRISPSDADTNTVETTLSELGVDGRPIIGFNPGAGWEIRRWPAEKFAELGKALIADGAQIVVFEGPEEPGLARSLADEVGAGAYPADGLSLGQLAAAMRRCSIVVSNDTGPSHIASAVGTPTLALMPGDAGPSPYAIRGELDRLVVGSTINAINVEEVLNTARAMLADVTTPDR